MPLIDTDQTREGRIPLEAKIPMTKEFVLKTCDWNSEEDPQLDYAADYLAKSRQH